VDGVLCINGKLYPSLIENLKKIVEKTGADIVLSSNWRLYKSYREHIAMVLGKYGMKIIGCTENKNDERPTEIFNWVRKNKPQMCIILDDRHLDHEKCGYKIKQCFIKTNYLTGLTTECVQKASFMLNAYCLAHDTYMLRILYNSRAVKVTFQELYNRKKKMEQGQFFLPTLLVKKIA
tara:strand:+ start:113 stop:646 length:534 start_codon:yes stop_codon:yes gene_type:complete